MGKLRTPAAPVAAHSGAFVSWELGGEIVTEPEVYETGASGDITRRWTQRDCSLSPSPSWSPTYTGHLSSNMAAQPVGPAATRWSCQAKPCTEHGRLTVGALLLRIPPAHRMYMLA